MEYLIYSFTAYFLIGFGFALASWLQAAKDDVKNKRKPSRFIFSKTFVFFVGGWWLVALYCYRAEVKRDIPTHHYFDKSDTEK
tara:strand:- start:5953 stop:6201 length:249 start_codon:yes stop_codon:yes gene_type:complete